MLKSHTALLSLHTALLFYCACLLITGTRSQISAQQYNRPAAQDSYQAGLKSLKKNSYEKALQQADAALAIDRDFAPAWFLKSNALVGLFRKEYKVSDGPNGAQSSAFSRLKEAADCLERYLRLVPASTNAEILRETLVALRTYGQLAGTDEGSRTVFRPLEVTTKARLLKRPFPETPERARQAGGSGRVVVLGVLDKDGEVRHLMVIESSGNELTKASLEAARGIKFTPAVKDGRPVATLLQVEYNFNVR